MHKKSIFHKNYLFYFFLIIIFINCSKTKPELENLAIDNTYGQLSDSTYLYDVSSISGNENYLFFAIKKSNQILYMNRNNLNIEKTIGRTGKGPGEFSLITKIILKDTNLYALSSGTKKINIFNINNGELLKEIKIPNIIGSFNFAIDNEDNIFFSDPKENSLITVIDNENNIINQFGAPEKFSDPMQTKYNNYGDIFFSNSKIIYIPFSNNPKIKIFNKNGDIEKIININDDYYIQKKINFNNRKIRKEKSKNVTYRIFDCSYIKNDKIYLIFHVDNKNKRNFYLYIISKSDGIIKKRYKMPESTYYVHNAFISNDKKLFLYDLVSGHVHEYSINSH